MAVEDLRYNVRVILGETEQAWDITTVLAKDDQQGFIFLRFAPGTDRDTIREVHKLVEGIVEGLIAE